MGLPKACSTLGQGNFPAELSLGSQKKLTFSAVQTKTFLCLSTARINSMFQACPKPERLCRLKERQERKGSPSCTTHPYLHVVPALGHVHAVAEEAAMLPSLPYKPT